MTAEQPSVEALVERVREALNLRMHIAGRPEGDITMAEAAIALDSLTAALERAERERGENDAKRVEAWQQLQVAEARILTLENEQEALLRGEVRDQLEARAQKAEEQLELYVGYVNEYEPRMRRAEAVVEAARELMATPDSQGPDGTRLRAALTAYDEPPTRLGGIEGKHYAVGGRDEPPTEQA